MSSNQKKTKEDYEDGDDGDDLGTPEVNRALKVIHKKVEEHAKKLKDSIKAISPSSKPIKPNHPRKNKPAKLDTEKESLKRRLKKAKAAFNALREEWRALQTKKPSSV